MHPTPEWFKEVINKQRYEPCRHYLKKGRCMFGEQCKYSHKEPDHKDSTTLEDSEEEMMRTPGEISCARQEERTGYCRHYLKGRCGYGEQCQYSHQHPQQDGYEPPAANSTRVSEMKCEDYPKCR